MEVAMSPNVFGNRQLKTMVDADLKEETSDVLNGLKESNGYEVNDCNSTNGTGEKADEESNENNSSQTVNKDQIDEDKENVEAIESGEGEINVTTATSETTDDLFLDVTESEAFSSPKHEIQKSENSDITGSILVIADDTEKIDVTAEKTEEVTNNLNIDDEEIASRKFEVHGVDTSSEDVTSEVNPYENGNEKVVDEELAKFENTVEKKEGKGDVEEINVNIDENIEIVEVPPSGEIGLEEEGIQFLIAEASLCAEDPKDSLEDILLPTPTKISEQPSLEGEGAVGIVRLDTPYPFHRISGRRALHGGAKLDNSFTVRSAPTTPSVARFPRLRKFVGQNALHNITLDESKKRPRDDEEEGPAAKRVKEGWWDWANPLHWLRSNNAKTDVAEEAEEGPSATECDSEIPESTEGGEVCVIPTQGSSKCHVM